MHPVQCADKCTYADLHLGQQIWDHFAVDFDYESEKDIRTRLTKHLLPLLCALCCLSLILVVLYVNTDSAYQCVDWFSVMTISHVKVRLLPKLRG